MRSMKGSERLSGRARKLQQITQITQNTAHDIAHKSPLTLLCVYNCRVFIIAVLIIAVCSSLPGWDGPQLGTTAPGFVGIGLPARTDARSRYRRQVVRASFSRRCTCAQWECICVRLNVCSYIQPKLKGTFKRVDNSHVPLIPALINESTHSPALRCCARAPAQNEHAAACRAPPPVFIFEYSACYLSAH